MKVIVLDIDGVLNSDETPNFRSFPYIVDHQLLGRFQELIDKTRATVVLPSTWRVDPIGRLAAKFQVLFDDVCPDLPDAPRCEEIQYCSGKRPEATRYVVLDDDDDCLDELASLQAELQNRPNRRDRSWNCRVSSGTERQGYPRGCLHRRPDARGWTA